MSKITSGPQKAATNAFQATRAYQAAASGKFFFSTKRGSLPHFLKEGVMRHWLLGHSPRLSSN